jgi:hypothetical protein
VQQQAKHNRLNYKQSSYYLIHSCLSNNSLCHHELASNRWHAPCASLTSYKKAFIYIYRKAALCAATLLGFYATQTLALHHSTDSHNWPPVTHALGYPHPKHDLLGTQWAQHHSISMNEREKEAESARRVDSAWIASFAHPYISDNGCWLKLITCNAAAAAPVPKQSHCTPQQTPPQNAEGGTQQCCADCG